MDIAIHLGAHCTDEDRILRALQLDARPLAAEGVVLPAPGKARPAIRKALQAGKQSLLDGTSSALTAELADRDDADRIVLSFQGFLGAYAKVLAGQRMYEDAGQKAAALQGLFPGDRVHFYLAIRNPASFIPAIFEASTVDDFATFLGDHDVGHMDWSSPIAAIRAACPDAPLTVWCNEDLPLIWPDVLRALSASEIDHTGDDMILREVMTKPGFARLQTYLRDNPPPGLSTWRKVATAFLGKYVDEAQVDEEIALPGWTQDVIAALTVRYEADIAAIKGRGDVTFLAP